MKNLFSLSFLVLFSIIASAQVSINDQPLSSKAAFIRAMEVPSIRLDAPGMDLIEIEDEQAELEGKPPRYSVHIPVGLTFENSGDWVELKGGARVWRLRVEASNALATTLMFDRFELPEGSRLHIYNDDRSSVIGAFSDHNNADGGTFATQIVLGEAFTIEYLEPYSVRGLGQMEISHVGYVYRYVYGPEDEPETRGGSQSCEVDVNCSEGNNWQDEKRGVVRIGLVFPNGGSWCSGSMVNNTSLNCAQYMLTALHCTDGSTNNNFGQYVFYFNYESSGCGSGSAPTNQTVVGCVPRADSNDGGGNSGSDFSLVEITPTIPAGYNAYFNGWNAQNIGSQSGVGIHHPAADRKKISTYTTQLTTTGWGINNTHWRVFWSGTANGHGVTEGGSSGSPLFDSQGRIVGTLTGGGSFCSQVPNPSSDAYGKMSYHWQSNPGDDLKDWLDPANTGQLTLAGTYAPCTPANQYDAGISAISQPTSSICANSITPVVTLSNYGSNTLVNVNIHYNVDGNGTQIYQWSGSLGTNQSTTVTLPAISVTSGNHTFNAYTSSPNGQADENNSNNAAASGFTVTIADTYVTLVLNTDDYGEETTWELVQNGGGTVASGGPYTNFENIQVLEELCVAAGECYTFTIYDSFGDGICCYTGTQNPNYQDGNYSIGNANGVSIWTGSEFTDDESVNFCVPSIVADCDTLYDPFFSNASGFALYGNNGGGYIAGSNSFGDLAKAQAFGALQQPAEITGIIFWTAAKVDDGADVIGNLYGLDGSGTDLGGATNAAPGTVLATGSKALARIDTSGFFNHVEFNSPYTVNGGFAVGLDFSDFGNSDALGIVTNTDGDANGADMAWEKWSDGNWYSMNEAWNSQTDADFDLGIFPIICAQNVTNIDDLSTYFSLFPNPNSGQFSIINSASLSGQMNVYNSVGQLIVTKQLSGQTVVECDLRGSVSGIYLVQVKTESGLWTSRVVLK